MEESQTDFGKIGTSATGLLHLMLAEFGLIYSNDWFMLPHPMPVNTHCEIRGIVVDDTFGRHRSSQHKGAVCCRIELSLRPVAPAPCAVAAGSHKGTLKRSAGARESVTG